MWAVLFILVSLAFIGVWMFSFLVRPTFRLGETSRDNRPFFARVLLYVAPIALVVWCFVHSIVTVPVGHIGVPVLFSRVQNYQFKEGWTLFVNPLLSIEDMTYRRRVLEFHSASASDSKDVRRGADNDVTVTSADDLPLSMDVTFAYSLNPNYASWVYRKMGGDEKYERDQVRQIARSATREAASSFSSHEATTSKREAFAKKMEDEFRSRLVADLVGQGLTKKEAEEVYIVYPVQLRKVLPPEKVLNAISEKNAALHDRDRQQTLTEIARIEAERRSNEGLGVAKLFENLPKDFTPEDIALILSAIADKERADAMMRAVQSGKVNIMVMDGGRMAPALPLAHPPR